MARRKENKVDLSSFDQAGARVFDNPLVTEVSDSYLEYAFSVIHSRAPARRARRPQARAPAHPLVDVRAGLPPRSWAREVRPNCG